MTRLILAALALAAAAPLHAAERRYTVTDFDRVQIDGPFVVRLSTGKPSSATAEGSDEAIERVSIDVQGRTLRIRPNRSAWGGYPGEAAGPLAIALTTHDLRGVSLTGSGSLTVDKAEAMRFDVAVSGSGGVTLGQVQADILVLGLLGSGRIAIGGRAETLRATVQGSGDLDAGALSVENAEINSDTAGSVEVAVSETAKVTATGPGDTRVDGSPTCTVQALGAGRVMCGKDRD
jgi:hypothetical protein